MGHHTSELSGQRQSGSKKYFSVSECICIDNYNEALVDPDLTVTTVKTETILASFIFGLCFIGYGFYLLYFMLLV